MDLNQAEQNWLANHLAHTLKTNAEFYKQHNATLEVAKVSKLLLLTENGQVFEFTGRRLSDIELDGEISLYPLSSFCTIFEIFIQSTHGRNSLTIHLSYLRYGQHHSFNIIIDYFNKDNSHFLSDINTNWGKVWEKKDIADAVDIELAGNICIYWLLSF